MARKIPAKMISPHMPFQQECRAFHANQLVSPILLYTCWMINRMTKNQLNEREIEHFVLWEGYVEEVNISVIMLE